MLPSNQCIYLFVSLAASVEVTHILLILLPVGTSQKEVTVTRFLLTSVFKGPDPSALSIGEISDSYVAWYAAGGWEIPRVEFYPHFFDILALTS